MGTDATHREGRTARSPTPPELSDDDVRDLLDRSAAVERPEAYPVPPEITDDDIRQLFSDAGWAPAAETRPDAAPRPTTDADPAPRETQCPSCYGSGTSVCPSCFGSGTQTRSYTTTDWTGAVEYVTEEYPCGCQGGSVACGSCGGRGFVRR